MSNMLSGVSSLSYQGTNASNPPNVIYQKTNPTQYDAQNVSIGDIWINTDDQLVFFLAALVYGLASWQQISGGTSNLTGLQGNSGSVVNPTGGVINVVGDTTTITSIGDPATSTITFSTTGSVARSYVTNAGTAVPSAGILNVVGSNVITTSGSGNTITAALTQGTNGQIIIGSSSGSPAWANITAGSNISIVNGANSITISSSAATTGIVTLDGDTGSATGSTVTLAGGTGIVTSASGSTVDISLEVPVIVANGGTGKTSFTPYAVVCGGTTSTSALQQVSGVGAVGQVLTSNGAGALPSWQSGGFGSTQGCFNAYISTAYANAIGNGTTTITVVFQTSSFDDTGSYNTGTGIFTAPSTGKYFLQGQALITAGVNGFDTNGISTRLILVTPSATIQSGLAPFIPNYYNQFPQLAYYSFPYVSSIFSLNAGDQCYIQAIGYTTNNMNSFYIGVSGASNFCGSLLIGQ